MYCLPSSYRTISKQYLCEVYACTLVWGPMFVIPWVPYHRLGNRIVSNRTAKLCFCRAKDCCFFASIMQVRSFGRVVQNTSRSCIVCTSTCTVVMCHNYVSWHADGIQSIYAKWLKNLGGNWTNKPGYFAKRKQRSKQMWKQRKNRQAGAQIVATPGKRLRFKLGTFTNSGHLLQKTGIDLINRRKRQIDIIWCHKIS